MEGRFLGSEIVQNKREEGFPSPEMLRTNVLDDLTILIGSEQTGDVFWVLQTAQNKREKGFPFPEMPWTNVLDVLTYGIGSKQTGDCFWVAVKYQISKYFASEESLNR